MSKKNDFPDSEDVLLFFIHLFIFRLEEILVSSDTRSMSKKIFHLTRIVLNYVAEPPFFPYCLRHRSQKLLFANFAHSLHLPPPLTLTLCVSVCMCFLPLSFPLPCSLPLSCSNWRGMCSTPLSWASLIGCRGNIRGRAPTRWRLFGKPVVWPLSLGRFWHLLFLSCLLFFFFSPSSHEFTHSFQTWLFTFCLFLFPAFTSMLHLFFFHLEPLLHFLPPQSYTYLYLKTLLLRRKRKWDVRYITYPCC